MDNLEYNQFRRKWLVNGVIAHNTSKPAYISPAGAKCWFLYGQRHRDKGPAIEHKDGYKEWWMHGKLHRDSGPAIEFANGSEEWYKHGRLHRVDGPAVIYTDGREEWWIDEVRQYDTKFLEFMFRRQKSS